MPRAIPRGNALGTLRALLRAQSIAHQLDDAAWCALSVLSKTNF